jgi:hypothetical protein
VATPVWAEPSGLHAIASEISSAKEVRIPSWCLPNALVQLRAILFYS